MDDLEAHFVSLLAIVDRLQAELEDPATSEDRKKIIRVYCEGLRAHLVDLLKEYGEI